MYKLFLTFLWLSFSTVIRAQDSSEISTLIKNVVVLDGSGKPGFNGGVRIKGNKIIAVGLLKEKRGEKVIDGKGCFLSPGFIDTHSHHLNHLKNNPAGIALTNQGITSIVIGQDGNSISMDSLANFFNHHRVAVNIATYTGHTTLREEAMGEKNILRAANLQELEQMKKRLADEMLKGSLGLSTGLEYEQAFYSSPLEVMELAKKAAYYHGRYISHIRSEDVTLDSALDEIIAIGRITGMPVQISHIKIGKLDYWGRSREILAKLDNERKTGNNITADVYPYTFWNSTLRVLFPGRDYENLESARMAVTKLCDPSGSVLLHFLPHPAYEHKTLAEIATERKEEVAATLIWLIKQAEEFRKTHPENNATVEAIAGKAMSEEDLETFLSWPQSNICSDGNAAGHPRGYGAFTRVLGRYVREKKLMSWEMAIYKMTGLAAAHLGWKNRGIITVGNYADLVLFDPKTVKDNASLENGTALSSGISGVWVNGKLVFEDQHPTNLLPGILLKNPTKEHRIR